MAFYSPGSYGEGGKNWLRIALVVAASLAVVAVLYGAYRFLGRGSPVATAVSSEPDLYGSGAADANGQVAQLISQTVSYMNASPPRIIEARDGLNEILPMSMGGAQREFVKGELSKLADEWLFGSKVLPGDKLCGYYKVESGDRLSKIGEQCSVPYEILMEINGISRPQQLRAGDTIKIINGPFHAKVYHSTFTLDLYLQNTFVRSFRVGLGKTGKDTPTGLWVVKSDGKLVSPTWTDPDTGKTYKAGDPDYPLGSRWIALKGVEGTAVGRTGFAIHGTKDPNQIGKADSRGCIRMYNGDAILMYNMLMPGISQVQVLD